MAHTPHPPENGHTPRVGHQPDYWILGTTHVTPTEVIEHANAAFAERIAFSASDPGSADSTPLQCTIDRTEQFRITIASTNPAATPRCHPVLGSDVDLDTVRSVITVQPHQQTNSEGPDGVPSRDARREQMYVNAELAATLATLPSSIAVCRVPHGVRRPFAIAAPTFVNAVLNDIVSGYLVDVVVTDEANPTGFTVGMVDAGHPELQWRGASLAAAELYNVLSDICQWALTRHQIREGDSLRVPGYPHPLTLRTAPWLVGTRSALELTP